MSDTLQERESGTTTDYCDECKGRPHAPWCSEFEPPETEANQLLPDGISSVSAGSQHQPAARGGGDDDDKPLAYMRRWAFEGRVPEKVKNDKGRWVWPREARFHDVTKVKVCADDVPLYATSQHQSLVAEREQMVEALKGVAIMLNTELEKYDKEPWAKRVRAAIATNEQRSTSE